MNVKVYICGLYPGGLIAIWNIFVLADRWLMCEGGGGGGGGAYNMSIDMTSQTKQ